jgi:hypothetical protein
MVKSVCGNSLDFSERMVTLQGSLEGPIPCISIFPRPEEPCPDPRGSLLQVRKPRSDMTTQWLRGWSILIVQIR